MDWTTVFDQLLPSDTWYVASQPLEHGYARLTWQNPSQTERYGLALQTATGEIYGNQILRASPQPQIVRLPGPLEPGAYALAIRPWNISAFSTPVKVEVDGELSLADDHALLNRLEQLISDAGASPNFANLEAIAAVTATDYLLVWRDGQLKRLLVSSLSTDDPPPPSGTVLTYQSDGDVNGLFYLMGTNYGGTSWNLENVRFLIELNSLTSIGYDGYGVFSRGDNEWVSNSSPSGQWFTVNLETKKIKLSKYSMKSGSEQGSLLRNWVLEGSSDNSTWTVLKNHVNDVSYSNAFEWKTFDVNASQSYQHFRLLMTGTHSGGANRMRIGQLEFYGILTDL